MVSGVLGSGPPASRARCAEDVGGAFQGESRPVLAPEHQVSAGLLRDGEFCLLWPTLSEHGHRCVAGRLH